MSEVAVGVTTHVPRPCKSKQQEVKCLYSASSKSPQPMAQWVQSDSTAGQMVFFYTYGFLGNCDS